jgi:16S rRNA (guanine966-N2)-methyltransferase
MRIIAGQRRGHKFDGPKSGNTRPTSDLVRESLFNILREQVVDRVVIDLFAGTGALGLEALSRGAERVIFVEQNRDNVALIHRNLTTLRYEDLARVHHTDAYRWVRGYEPADDDPVVVFLDPPYREFEQKPDKMNQLLEALVQKLPEGSVIAVESRSRLDADVLPGFEAWDVRRYGGTQIAIRDVARASGPRPSPPIDDDEPPDGDT